MVWHEDINERIKKGESAQHEFEEIWYCSCGHTFTRIDNYCDPDYVCPSCEKRVEVKGSKLRDDMTIAISQKPMDNMKPETIIAWRYDVDKWSGVERKDAVIYGGPYEPTHTGPHSTRWYSVDVMNFTSLENLGLRKK